VRGYRHDVHLGERPGRPRHPRGACSKRATSSIDAVRSSRAGTATRRSPSSPGGDPAVGVARAASQVTEGSLWAGAAALASASRVGDRRRGATSSGRGELRHPPRLRRSRHRPADARGADDLQLSGVRPRPAVRPACASRSSP
jgi:hypothetical protein